MSDDADDVSLDPPVDRPHDDVAAIEAPWRTLHPASLLVNLLPQAWAVARQAWPLLLAIVLGRTARGGGSVDLLVVVVFAAMAIANTFVHWATLRWRLVDGRLEILTGLLQRNRRVIPRAKVQNVELVRNVFHRLAGLVEVRIETASGTEVEGLLSALTATDADELVAALSTPHQATPGEPVRPDDVLAVASVVDVLKFGATSARIGALAVGLGLLFDVTASTDPTRVGKLGAGLGMTRLGALFVAGLALAWGMSVVTAVLRHHGFRLVRHHDRLVAEEGLVTRRRVELPLRKVQLVSMREPVLRRALGFGSISIETAAARAGSGGTERSLTIVPVVGHADVDRLVREALPTADVALATATWLRPDPRALRRGLVRGAIEGVVLASLLGALWYPWGLLSIALAWVPAALAWLDWRNQGWLVTDEVVVARRGWLDRATTVVTRDKLQAVEVAQGPLQRRWGLGEVVLRVAGSAVSMPLLDHDRAFALATSLSASVEQRSRRAGGARP